MNEQQEAAQMEAAKKQLLQQVLTKDALERLGRVRLANPVLTTKLETYLIQVFQTGQLGDKVDDKRLKEILDVLTEKRKTNIRRR